MEKSLDFYNIVLEVTRRCNMCCAHCLRGEPEPRDMNPRWVRELFSKVSYISTLTLTGGEPSLRPRVVQRILDEARWACRPVDIGSFYMVTNGKRFPPAMVRAIHNWYGYCCDNEATALQVSNDCHHDRPDPDVLYLLAEEFEFYSRRGEGNSHYRAMMDSGRGIIAEGRASNWGTRALPVDRFEMHLWEDDGRCSVDGSIYMNYLGQLFVGCDWSYETQRKKECSYLGHVRDLSFDMLRKSPLADFNEH